MIVDNIFNNIRFFLIGIHTSHLTPLWSFNTYKKKHLWMWGNRRKYNFSLQAFFGAPVYVVWPNSHRFNLSFKDWWGKTCCLDIICNTLNYITCRTFQVFLEALFPRLTHWSIIHVSELKDFSSFPYLFFITVGLYAT